jgi:hypothetical protein
MRSALRVALVAAIMLAAIGVAATAASATPQPVVAKNDGVECPPFTSGIPGSEVFEGGCEVTAHSDSLVFGFGSDAADCVVDLVLHIDADGSIGINGIDIALGTPNCTQIVPCLEPSLPWGGQIAFEDSVGAFQATIDPCVDTASGSFGGPTTGELTNGVSNGGACVTPPRLEFDDAPIGTSAGTLDGVFDLAPEGGDPCDLTIEEA